MLNKKSFVFLLISLSVLLFQFNFVNGIVWSGGTSGTNNHNDLAGLQGGAANEYYHLDQNFFDEIINDAFSWLTATDADALYAGIEWDYNQTMAGASTIYDYNHTLVVYNNLSAYVYNYSLVGTDAFGYNHTLVVYNNLSSQVYNHTFVIQNGIYWYNQTIPAQAYTDTASVNLQSNITSLNNSVVHLTGTENIYGDKNAYGVWTFYNNTFFTSIQQQSVNGSLVVYNLDGSILFSINTSDSEPKLRIYSNALINGSLNITGNLFVNGENVSKWLYNQTAIEPNFKGNFTNMQDGCPSSDYYVYDILGNGTFVCALDDSGGAGASTLPNNQTLVLLPVIKTPQTGQLWTNMPTVMTEMFGNTFSRQKLDLSTAQEVRMVESMSVTGFSNATANCRLWAVYSTTGSGAITTWSNLSSTNQIMACNATATATQVYNNSWSSVANGAKQEVYISVVGGGSHLTTSPNDPVWRQLDLQFKVQALNQTVINAGGIMNDSNANLTNLNVSNKLNVGGVNVNQWLYNQSLNLNTSLQYNQSLPVINELHNNYYNQSIINDLIPSQLTYYFWDVTSYNATFNTMNVTQNPTLTNHTITGLTNGAIIVFGVNINTNLTGLSGGSLHVHTSATKTAGLKDLQIVGKLHKLLLNGTIVLIATTDTSPVLTTGQFTNLNLFASVPQQTLNVTDRLLWKLEAVVTGAGTNPDVSVSVGGVTQNGLDLPVTVSNIVLDETDPFLNRSLQYNHTIVANQTIVNAYGKFFYNMTIGGSSSSPWQVANLKIYNDTGEVKVGVGTSTPNAKLESFFSTSNTGNIFSGNFTAVNTYAGDAGTPGSCATTYVCSQHDGDEPTCSAQAPYCTFVDPPCSSTSTCEGYNQATCEANPTYCTWTPEVPAVGGGNATAVFIASTIAGTGTAWGIYDTSPRSYFANKVGVGTASPTTALDVRGNVSLNSTFYVQGDKVGIGTATPVGKLNVVQTATSGSIFAINATSKYTGAGSGTPYGLWVFAQDVVDGTQTTYGVYAIAKGGSVNWAGWFDSGNVKVTNNLIVGGSNSSSYKLQIEDASGKGLNASNNLFVNSTSVGIGTANPLSLLTIGNGANNITVNITGALNFGGGAKYVVGDNRYAFVAAADNDIGLYFNNTLVEFQFRNGTADAVFRISAVTGNTSIRSNLHVAGHSLLGNGVEDNLNVTSADINFLNIPNADPGNCLTYDATSKKVSYGSCSIAICPTVTNAEQTFSTPILEALWDKELEKISETKTFKSQREIIIKEQVKGETAYIKDISMIINGVKSNPTKISGDVLINQEGYYVLSYGQKIILEFDVREGENARLEATGYYELNSGEVEGIYKIIETLNNLRKENAALKANLSVIDTKIAALESKAGAV